VKGDVTARADLVVLVPRKIRSTGAKKLSEK